MRSPICDSRRQNYGKEKESSKEEKESFKEETLTALSLRYFFEAILSKEKSR
jgi:hypothetical protein